MVINRVYTIRQEVRYHYHGFVERVLLKNKLYYNCTHGVPIHFINHNEIQTGK